MNLFRLFTVIALALIIVLTGPALVEAKKGSNKKRAQKSNLNGVIVNVTQSAPGKTDSNNLGEITVKTKQTKKKPSQEVKILVTKNTKIETIRGKKNNKIRTPADFNALLTGKHVIVKRQSRQSNQADAIEVKGGKGRKKR